MYVCMYVHLQPGSHIYVFMYVCTTIVEKYPQLMFGIAPSHLFCSRRTLAWNERVHALARFSAKNVFARFRNQYVLCCEDSGQ
jgi:hypothetical protein